MYYSNGKNKLYRYNEDNEKSDTVCTFKDKSFVRYFQYFNNTMIVLVREPNDNGKMYQYVLYYLDNDNKPQKIIDDKDFKLHKFISNGEWDYDTYAEIQAGM